MSESLFDAVRDDPQYAQLPVVLISDTPEAADASLRKRQAEHVMLIPKPFTGGQVARALDELTAS
jgi:CheY-like chemotaxis protein